MAILFAVPKGTQPAVCKAASCGKTIFWVLTARGKRMPIDIDVEHGKAPTASLPGQGIPHWARCVEADSFRKPRTGVSL